MKSILKSILKILFAVFLVLYVGVAVFVTACLLCLNDQGITEFGDTSLVIADDDLSADYKKGDLLVISKGKEKGAEVTEGDYVFFYNPSESYVINYAEVKEVHDTDGYYTYVVGNDYNIYYDYYVGKDVVNLKGVGNVLAVLESQMGFLALIILPTMIAIIFEIYAIIIEIVELKKEV